MTTETQERFEEVLKILRDKLDKSILTHKDGNYILDLAENLLLRYEQIRISRDKWKDKHDKLKDSPKRGKVKK